MKIPSISRCILLLVVCVLIECTLIGFIGFWREWFWAAVEARQVHKFILYLIEFSVVAFTACLIAGYSQYLISYVSLLFRRKLTNKALKSDYKRIEGGNQRVQEDCISYPSLLVSLCVGGSKSILTLGIFIYIIVFQLGWIYLMIPVLYTIGGTMIAGKLAVPLINLNYLNQNVEAKFRQLLTKRNYALVHRNNYNLFKTTKYLAYFQSFYNQITVIVPYIIIAPIYFTAKITFGTFMQCASSINHIIESLSYIINSFNDINKWLSCRRRLKELGVIT